VKTSLAPGSRVVTEYLKRAGLTPYLEKLASISPLRCTTCIGTPGRCGQRIEETIAQNDLVCAAVLSAPQLEARIHASCARTSSLHRLVVTYAPPERCSGPDDRAYRQGKER